MHGPPGTGKTYMAARVVARLVTEHHWRVGVVAQSHAVVENLFDSAIDAGVDSLARPRRIRREGVRWQEIDEQDYPGFIAGTAGCVIGGTAWDFANSAPVPTAVLTCW